MIALCSIKNRISSSKIINAFMITLIIAQPFLDVLSYFLIQIEKTTFTTLLRMLMFALIMLYSFIISSNKKAYYIFAAIAGGYFVLHMANCFRIGYMSLVEDVANFLRTVQMPALTIAFVTLLKKIKTPIKTIGLCFFINVFSVWLVIGLSFLTGKPVYTYGEIKLGLMGWFGVHNAQSAIVMLLMPIALCFAYKVGMGMFAFASVSCFSLLFFTGTKLTFYSIFLLAIAFLMLILINFFGVVSDRKFYITKNVLPIICLLLAVALSMSFIEKSPMHQRLSRQNTAYNNHQTMMDDNMSAFSSSEESSSSEEIDSSSNVSSDTSSDIEPEEKNENEIAIDEYETLYRDLAGGFLSDIVDEYGIERVAEKYNYTTKSYVLLNTRQKKNIFAELAWEDSDLLTKCVGYEYKTLVTDKEIYDLENDFPSIFYYSGYIGFALYVAFLLYFAYLIVRELVKDFKNLFSFESGMLCVSFFLLMGAAQFSGNVLRRPNVSIYLSLILACMYIIYNSTQGEKKQSD